MVWQFFEEEATLGDWCFLHYKTGVHSEDVAGEQAPPWLRFRNNRCFVQQRPMSALSLVLLVDP